MTSLWARWRLKSPASRLFTQVFIRAQIKENIKAPRHWPLCGEFTGDRWIPRTNGMWRGKCFHWMTSSCTGCEIHVLGPILDQVLPQKGKVFTSIIKCGVNLLITASDPRENWWVVVHNTFRKVHSVGLWLRRCVMVTTAWEQCVVSANVNCVPRKSQSEKCCVSFRPWK